MALCISFVCMREKKVDSEMIWSLDPNIQFCISPSGAQKTSANMATSLIISSTSMEKICIKLIERNMPMDHTRGINYVITFTQVTLFKNLPQSCQAMLGRRLPQRKMQMPAIELSILLAVHFSPVFLKIFLVC